MKNNRTTARIAALAGVAAAASCALAGPSTAPSAILLSSVESVNGFVAGSGIAPVRPEFPNGQHPTRVLVRFDPFVDRDAAAEADTLSRSGVRRTIERIDLVPGLLIVEADEGSVDAVVAKLMQQPGVLYATPDREMHAEAQSMPYGIAMIGADQVWPSWGNGNGVKVCVLDTGVDTAHPDLPVALTNSFVPGETVEDYNRHGTHCSGTILALDNTDGVVGVAPTAQLLIGKALANSGSGSWSYLISGINWAVANGARVISMSLSGSGADPSLQAACDAALANGVLLVAAAGNQASGTTRYPAGFSSVMAISAVDSGSNFASFSNFGSHISVAAPGVSVQSSVPVVAWNANWLSVNHPVNTITGGVIRAVTAPAVYCGFGENAAAFPPSVSGKIAHVRRGSPDANSVSFFVKANNALTAGAIGVIISNNVAGGLQGTLNVSTTFAIPVVGASQADGDDLLANNNTTVNIYQYNNGHSYANFDGTSMATPHVAGAAGLLLGSFVPANPLPAVPPATTRWVLEQTSTDEGAPGKDTNFGWGIINVRKAAEYLHGRIRCPGDLFFDSIVDDADFVAFVGYYDALIAPGGPYTGGDFDGNGQTDDGDFVRFVSSYDSLICP
ncbi:MAG: S8 family serine peptidase [Phycisphaerae bacterium]|nr:S8 family serine peptidase [Phycisphaerae bacterium]MBN8596224.1 S8 family serine peptidase [Planctomycetota bacterium]